MKSFKLSIVLLLLGSLTSAIAEVSIDEQIAAIGTATPQKRVELVNEFKKTLSTLSDQERARAITQLRSQMQTGEETQTRTQTQTMQRERSRVKQMEQTENMQRLQQMSQHQTATQVMQQAGSTGNTTPKQFMRGK
jgi:TolA-binding protein